MTDLYINSVSDYLEKIMELNKESPNNPLMNNPTKSTFLFRGMEDCQYKLLPSVFRTVEDTPENRPIENRKYLSFSDERTMLLE